MSANKPKVIGLLGRRLSGKTTAAEHYVKTRGARRISFASPLKRLCGRLYSLSSDQLYGDLKEAEFDFDGRPCTPRELLQHVGTACRDVFGEDFWIEQALQEILRFHTKDAAPMYVIDDVRYRNEAQALATDPRLNGCVVKLLGEGTGVGDSAFDAHPSEAEVDLVPKMHVFRELRNKRDRSFFSDLDNVSYEFAVQLMPIIARGNK